MHVHYLVDKGVSAAPSGTKAVPRVTKPVSMVTTSLAGNRSCTYEVGCIYVCVIMYFCTLNISVSGVSAAPSGTKAVPRVTKPVSMATTSTVTYEVGCMYVCYNVRLYT